jgi:quinol monooxygenase YgiN
MSIVTVVAKLIVREDAVDVVKTQLLKLVEPTRQEEGCIEYRLHQDNTDPGVFIFYENWESMAALDRHITTPHYKQYTAAIEGAVKEKIVHKMTCIA